MADELEAALSELQRGGALDSHGNFSIDFAQAARSLGSHLLPGTWGLGLAESGRYR